MSVLTLLAPFAGAFLFASILCAQAPGKTATPSSSPKPVDPAVEALLAKMAGKRGAAKPGKDTTIVLQGSYVVTFQGVGEVAKGALREIWLGADMARSTSDVAPRGTMEKGIAGELVWEVDPQMGACVRRGADAGAVRRYFALLRGDDPRTLYRTIEPAGSEKVDGRDCTVLKLTPAEGKADTWFVDGDGALLRVDTALAAPESADAAFGMGDQMDTRITFVDWHDTTGGRFPKQRVLVMGQAKVTSTFATATVGDKLDAAAFAPPESVTKAAAKAADTKPAFGADGKPNYQIVEMKAQAVASIRTKVKVTEISTQLAVLLPEVGLQLAASGVRPAGAPFARYHAVADGEVDLEAGIAVSKPIQESDKSRVKNSELPAGKAVSCWHIGPYDQLGVTRAALTAHLAAEKQKARGGVWAVFWTDPGMVPDPAKWKTQLFAPIE